MKPPKGRFTGPLAKQPGMPPAGNCMPLSHKPAMTLKEAFMRRLESYEQELLADPSLVAPERLKALQAKGFAVPKDQFKINSEPCK